MNAKWIRHTLGGHLGLLALLLGIGASAQTFGFRVTLETTALSGTHGVFFGLTQATSHTANDLTITDFDWGGGSATGSAILGSGASGDMYSTVHLTEASFTNEFQQTFTPGSQMIFDVILPDINVGKPTPDRFAFSLLDAGGTVSTNDPIAGTALVGWDLTSNSPHLSDIEAYGYTVRGTTYTAQITAIPGLPAATPEPSSWVLGTGIAIVGLLMHRRMRRPLYTHS